MGVDRFRQWWTGETEKLRELPPGKRLAYIWSYYKLWISGVLIVAFVLIWGIHQYVTTNSENWFFACFANTRTDIGNGSEFWEGYANYARYDLSEKDLVFNAQLYFDPAGHAAGNQYYQLLIAYMDSGTLDVLVMGKEQLQTIGATGRLIDLADERLSAIHERYKDRLIYCEPADEEYEKDLVPVGIDLSGTILCGEGHAYPDGAALGINALAPHLEDVEIFLTYLFEYPNA